MKKIIFTFSLLILSSIVFSQSLVAPATLNFVRPSNSAGAFSSVKILVNDQHIGDIENGSTYSYKLFISAKGNISVNVNSSIYNKSISFDVEPGKTYNFETGFVDQGLFLLAIDDAAYSKHAQNLNGSQQGKATQTANQSAFVASPSRGQEASESSQPISQFDINRKDGSVTYQYEKELDSEAIRKQWLEKGGTLKGTSFTGGVSYLFQETDDFYLEGYGVNAAYNQNVINLKVPQYTKGPAPWSSFHWGYGIAGSYTNTLVEIETIDVDGFGNIYYTTMEVESSFANLMVNLNAGFTFGLGRFLSQTQWKGAVVELNYKPTLNMWIPEEGESTTSFNFSGFSIDFNSSDFNSTMNKIAPKANFKFSLFFLPPVDDLPFFVSISLGAVWYSK